MTGKTRNPKRDRSNERGAAMVMALLISFLLLVASAGLLMESSMNTANVTDLTAEQQAYNAAESGIQSAVNVLRGNVVPSPLIDDTKPATDPVNRISFVKALTPALSNDPSDTSTRARLSRWMGYHSTYTDRVAIGPNTYTPNAGYAYSLAISDPDNTGKLVSFMTNGRFFDSDTESSSQKTYGTSGNTVRIRYIPTTATDLDTSGGTASTNFGTFNVEINGNGAAIPSFNRFEINITMTKPYFINTVIRGYIETNAGAYNVPPKIIFDAQTFTVGGSVMTLGFGWGSPVNQTIVGPPQRYGYEADLQLGNNVTTGTITSPEPRRLLIRSAGYGPRGALKQLEAIIQKDFFNGLTAPATLTLVGPPSTTNPNSSFTFNPGSSAVTVYSGDDAVSTDIIPPIGTTNPSNLDDVQGSVDGQPPHPFNGTVIGAPSDVSGAVPPWLSSPSQLDQAVRSLYNIALASGRYFPSGVQPSTYGSYATGQGITFCDGNCSFTGQGGGIMVVTGKLTLQGNFSFKGLIIVTGASGVDRLGAGNGEIQGNMVIAPYQNSGVLPASDPVGTSFLAPQYDMSGGGNSTIMYNSQSVAAGLVAVSNFVLGIVEK